MFFTKKPNFPDDVNGDVLRRMVDSGMDLSQTYDMEFFHVFTSKEKAEGMCKFVYDKGIRVKLNQTDDGNWDVCCIIPMVPTYKEITETECKLEKIAENNGGVSEGWGVLQN